MTDHDTATTVEQIKDFAKLWNELYAAEKFDAMKDLATEDVGIANASASDDPSGLIFGRDEYKRGIVEAYKGETGDQHNLLVMDYENWEYIAIDDSTFYTIGRYSLQPNIIGINCWLLHRCPIEKSWKIFRVINN